MKIWMKLMKCGENITMSTAGGTDTERKCFLKLTGRSGIQSQNVLKKRLKLWICLRFKLLLSNFNLPLKGIILQDLRMILNQNQQASFKYKIADKYSQLNRADATISRLRLRLKPKRMSSKLSRKSVRNARKDLRQKT